MPHSKSCNCLSVGRIHQMMDNINQLTNELIKSKQECKKNQAKIDALNKEMRTMCTSYNKLAYNHNQLVHKCRQLNQQVQDNDKKYSKTVQDFVAVMNEFADREKGMDLLNARNLTHIDQLKEQNNNMADELGQHLSNSRRRKRQREKIMNSMSSPAKRLK